MEARPSFSLFPLITQKPDGTETASKRGFIPLGFELLPLFLDGFMPAVLFFLFFVALQFTFLNCFCAVGDELNDEAGSRAFQSHGRPQSQFEDRMWMQSRWTAKRRSRIRKSINRKNLNLRKNLVKFIWWVHCLFLVLYKYLFVCYSTDINLFKI